MVKIKTKGGMSVQRIKKRVMRVLEIVGLGVGFILVLLYAIFNFIIGMVLFFLYGVYLAARRKSIDDAVEFQKKFHNKLQESLTKTKKTFNTRASNSRTH